MSKSKRFVIGDDNLAMFEVIDMEKEELVCECRVVDVETLVDLLNSLAEENEKLNSEMKINLKEFSRLLKQNFAQKREINGLQAENIQLKQVIWND